MSTRENTSRAATQRQALGDKPRGSLDADLTGLPSNLEPVWVREKIAGMVDEPNLIDAEQRGLMPATTDMLPQARVKSSWPGREAPKDNLIRSGSMILCVGHKADRQAERDLNVARVQQQIASVKRIGSDPGAALDEENFIEASEVHEKIERGRPKAKFAD